MSKNSSTSSPAVGRSTNDKVSKGSNPRFSPFKGIGKLKSGAGVSKTTKANAKKVAVASGAKTRHVTSPTKAVSKSPRPIPGKSAGRKNVKPGQNSYPSKRLLAIMDADERSRYVGR